MLKLKLVLFAIILIIGCAFALAPQEETAELTSSEYTYEDDPELPEYGDEYVERDIEERDVAAETEVAASACKAPSKTSSSSSSSSSSSKSTQAPTSRPASTQAPTSRPASTQAPTSRPSSTQKPSTPTSAPTTRPSSTQKPASTPAATQKPTTKPGSSSSSVGLCDVTSEPLKLLVPLYVYPGSAWDTVASSASKVATIAIINPNSGPDASGPDSSYNTYMTKLKNAGVEMVGYVYTSYGARAISAVKADIDTYASKYPGVTGIFFDEASNSASEISFYTQAYNYVISKGMKHSILNPGVQPDSGYLAISTNIVIFENSGSAASGSKYDSWVKCAPSAAQKSGYKYKFSGIAHSTSSSSAASILNTFKSQGMGLVYVTDGAAGCCTYNALTTYLASEASSVASLNVA